MRRSGSATHSRRIDLHAPWAPGRGSGGAPWKVAPSALKRIATDGRARLVGGEDAAHDVQQQVDLQLDAQQIRGMRGVLVRLLRLALLLQGRAGLQHADVGGGVARGEVGIDLDRGSGRQATGSTSW